MRRRDRILGFSFLLILFLMLWCLPRSAAAPDSLFLKRYCAPAEQALTVPSVNGWCATDWWIPGIVTNATHWRTPPVHFLSRALGQDDGVLEATIALKGYDTTGVQGLISLLSPATAGWKMHIRFPTRPEWG